MIVFVAAVLSLLSFRLRRRAALELEVIALRHQLGVLRRQSPRRLRLRSSDRLLWVWLYVYLPNITSAHGRDGDRRGWMMSEIAPVG